jgi:hypothetical protein
MRTRRSEAEWAEIVAAYRRSGLSVGKFAAASGVALSSLQYRLRRSGGAPRGPATFVEVPWKTGASAPPGDTLEVEIRLGEEVVVRASSWPPASWLAKVWTVAREREC